MLRFVDELTRPLSRAASAAPSTLAASDVVPGGDQDVGEAFESVRDGTEVADAQRGGDDAPLND